MCRCIPSKGPYGTSTSLPPERRRSQMMTLVREVRKHADARLGGVQEFGWAGDSGPPVRAT
jgi:hypothetical protein